MFSQLYPETPELRCYHSFMQLAGMQRAGFILTGGRSSRMGRDKALLEWRGATVAEHLAGMAGRLVGQVCLVGEPDRYRHLPLRSIPDLRPGNGPLGGLETALAATDAEFNLVLACDQPLVGVGWLSHLMETAENEDWDCVGTRDARGHFHPLCAVYRHRCLRRIQAALDRGEFRLLRVLEDMRVKWEEASDAVPNINTPEDWHAIERP